MDSSVAAEDNYLTKKQEAGKHGGTTLTRSRKEWLKDNGFKI